MQSNPRASNRASPSGNAFVGSLQGELRDECLSHGWLASSAEDIRGTEAQHLGCDRFRPHRPLGDPAPQAFARQTARDGELPVALL
jgi:hypothetical protein